MRAIRLGLCLAITALCGGALAEPLAREAVPAPLAPWVDWVLRGHEAERCPFFQGQAERRACIWPARLELELDDAGGRFRQEWRVEHASRVPLPGDARRWPQDVAAGGRALAVVEHAGVPSAELPAGRHTLTGRFAWDALPELLQVPPETGLLALRLRGAAVRFPNRDAQGRLWLQPRSRDEGGEERLELRVHRRLVDEIPVELETRVELRVSGESREALLGRALPEGFVPLALASPLPARLDPDGRLRVQVRPGRHTVVLRARHQGPVESLAPPPEPGGPWAEGEVWVFEARPHLRMVSVEGGVPIDPTQTTLPDAWRALPAYRMEPGRPLRLVEERRGDADPAPDRLSLEREWWLDFDGAGYTLRDVIQGEVRRSTRLEMGEGTDLGRVAFGGRDQLITRLDDSPLAGVEVPPGAIALEAESRHPTKGRGWLSRALPAVGWDQDVHALAGRLNLPPGWRLFHATGVDRATPSWITRWTLLDLFAVLVLAGAVARLWRPAWGGVALLALGLSWIEPGAPRWIWAAVLGGEALRRVLPEARFPRLRRTLALGHAAALAALVLLAVPFAAAQLRAGLYPALQRPGVFVDPSQDFASAEDKRELEMLGYVEGRERSVGRSLADAVAPKPGSSPRFAPLAAESASSLYLRDAYAPDPSAKITTGPGLPAWAWERVTLHWSGPVGRDQALRLYLLPPWAGLGLALLRAAALAALVLCALAGLRAGTWPGGRSAGGAPLRAGALGLALAVGLAPAALRAELPSPELLEELRRRLLEKPECAPHCAASPRLVLEAGPDALRARIEVQAAAEVAVPLPGGARSWTPERIWLDGQPAAALLRDGAGTLWVRVGPGRHQLVAEGALPARDSIELALPLHPRHVEVRARGWSVHGVHADGAAEGNLQLVREREASTEQRALEPGELPPFVRVERNLVLGLEWEVHTRILRLSPPDAALVLQVPLLPGESVTTPGVRTADASALVSLGPGVAELRWRSALEPRAELALRASAELPASESWTLHASPVWHVDAEGIPPVHQPAASAAVREWRPWPGEQVVLRVRRPEGVAGETTTLDASLLTLTPGLRATDASLVVTLRSSRGGEHPIALPESAELQRVAIDGTEQPIRLEAGRLRVPLRPGRQQVEIAWREPHEAQGLFWRASPVDLGAPSVNASLHVVPSAGRWLLWLDGPRLGPAVLFWPLLAVFAAVAYGLGRLSDATELTPLRFRHWLLLGVGLSQVPVPAAALVVAWLLALGWRRRHGAALSGRWLDAAQVGLVGLTLAALVALYLAIHQGLLGAPEMQVAGNASTGNLLRWYEDRADALLPQPWLVSVPLGVYRLAMLAWSLWLALALLGWLRWAWDCFSAGELWRPLRRARVTPEASAAGPGPA